jgi:hypothetical protein
MGRVRGDVHSAAISLLGGASDESIQDVEDLQDNTPGEGPENGAEGRQEGIERLCRW